MYKVPNQDYISELESILNSQDSIIIRTLPDGEIIFANQKFAKFYGLDSTPVGCNIKKLGISFFSDKFDTLKSFISIKTPRLTYEATFSKLKEDISLEVNCLGFFDGTGNLEFLQCVATDITKRKRIEKNIRVSEQRYKLLLENTEIFAVILDTAGKILYVNNYLSELIGGSGRKIIGLNWFDNFVEEEERENIKSQFLYSVKLRSLETLPENFSFTAHANMVVSASWKGNFINNEIGEIKEIAFIGRNKTETDLLLENIAQKEKRFRVLYDSLPVGVLVLDKNRRITLANRQATRIFNTTKEALTSMDPNKINWRIFDEKEVELETDDFPTIKTLVTGIPFRNYICGAYLNNPENFKWVMVNTEPVFDSKTGEVKEVIISFHDVSRLIATESQLRDHRDELERRIKTIDCLYKINAFINGPKRATGEILDEILNLLYDGMSIPEKMGIRIKHLETEHVKGKFEKTGSLLSRAIFEDNEIVGTLEVSCLSDEQTEFFQREDKLIVETTANALSEYFTHQNAQNKLTESESSYRILVEASPDGICRLLNDGKITFCNKKALKLLGLKKHEEITGKNISEFLINSDGFYDETLVQNILSFHGQNITECWLTGEHNKKIPVEIVVIIDETKSEIILILRDLSDKIRKEEQVKKHRERLALALEATSDAIWDWNVKRDKGFYSPRYYTMLGYNPDDFSPNSKYWEELLHPGDRNRIISRLSEYVEGTRDHYIEEFRLRCKDGSYKWILGRGKIIETDEQGRATRIIGTHQDITYRKLSEQRLKENESKLLAVFNQTFQFTGLIDITGKLISVNSTALSFIGKEESELIGKYFWETPWWTHSEYEQNRLKETIKKAVSGETSRYFTTHKNTLGNLSFVDFTLKPIKDSTGNIEFLLAEGRDITETINAEQALKRSEEGLIEAQKLAKIGSFRYNIESGVMYWSDELYQIFDVSSGSFKPDFEYFFEIVDSTDGVIFEQNGFQENWKNIPFNLEYLVKTIKGVSKHIQIISKHKVRDGKLHEIVGTVQDISDRKRIENELIVAKNMAMKSDKLKSEFLAQMSHEIRTPINILLSSSSLIEEFVKHNVDEDILMLFNGMRRAGKRIIRTIDLILNMSELQTGTYNFSLKQLDLQDEILKNLFIEFKNSTKEKGLTFSILNNATDTIVKGDEYTLNQIFANLLDNAIKYTHDGKIEILLENPSPKELDVTISDTGIGMSAEYLSKIFEPFSQEDQGYTRKYEGNGLGLSLVKKYCELNSSKISVRSQKGVGTTFNVTLPLA